MYPQVFGKYVLERELARGGMARVLLATLRGAGGFEKKLVVKQIRDELAFDEDFVTRFVDATGHCAFTPEQTGHAFDALREWAKTGKRPMAGELR